MLPCRSLLCHRRRGRVRPDELLFFANWQLQAAAAARAAAAEPGHRAWLAAWLAELAGDVLDSGFFADVAEAGVF